MLCPVWMAPFLQVLFCDWFFVRSSLVFGLLTRRTWPLALMVSTNQAPFRMSNSKRSGLSTGCLGFRADNFPSLHWSCNLLLLASLVRSISLCRVHYGSAQPTLFGLFYSPLRLQPPGLACVPGCPQTKDRISPVLS